LQKLIKKSHILSSIVLLLISANSCRAEDGFQEIQDTVEEVIEKHTLEKQEFKPIIYTDIERESDTRKNLKKDSNSKYRSISFKNEFFQSIKLSLTSKNDFKIVYLNPYEKLDEVVINNNEDYKIQVFNLDEKYIGNMIKTDLRKKDLVRVSPFLIFPELANDNKDNEIRVIEKSENSIEKIEIKPIKPESIEPKKIQIVEKINPLKPEPITTETKREEGNQFKIANISDFKVKVSIKKANGESIGTNWTIDNDVYSPEPLKFASQPVILEPDTNINIMYLDKDDNIKKELNLPANQIPKDPHNNYTYFIENIASD
jgi:hypothetical protein